MKNLILLFTFIIGLVSTQAQESNEDLRNRLIIDKMSTMQVSSIDQKEFLLNIYDSIHDVTKDQELRSLIIQKKESLNNQKFNDVKSVDLKSLDKKERRGWEFKEDKFKSITFIKKKTGIANRIYPYIGVKDNGTMYMRLSCRYSGSEWAFVTKITFMVDNEKIDFYPTQKSRNVSSSALVTEYFDDEVDAKTMELLRKIAASPNPVEYRMSGQRSRDFKMKELDRTTIREVLELYDRLKLN